MRVAVLALAMLAAITSSLPLSAKVEPTRPSVRPILEVEPRRPRAAGVPCLQVKAPERERVIVWTIRAADGTVLAVGATEVRQRC
ncbi:hypothetical protein ABIA24_001789 [Sinorhizobium fredii]|uniref:hypothetical protein n=1 Tax=Rhizobium fredii TaxID=380 RepID=UPI0035154C80